MVSLLIAANAVAFALIAVFFFRRSGAKPAVFYVLAAYLPFQNVILPSLAAAVGYSGIRALMPFKEAIVVAGALAAVLSGASLRIRLPDIVAACYVLVLIANVALSPSDVVSALYGMRDYSIPVLLYVFGRLAYSSAVDVRRILLFLASVGTVVAGLSVGEYALQQIGASPFPDMWFAYFADAYGYGTPMALSSTHGFLGMDPLDGLFGNSLITSTYLRFSLAMLLSYLALAGRTAKCRDMIMGGLMAGATVLCLSRWALAALSLMLVAILISSGLLGRFAKFVMVPIFAVLSILAFPTIEKVARATLSASDASTMSHMSSIRGLEFTLFGSGLGTGVHAPAARASVYADQASSVTGTTDYLEGILRQGIPEIGVLGVGLLMAFSAAVLLELFRARRRGTKGIPPEVWVATPILFALLRTPVDIALRGFLSTGLAWFMAGLFISRHRQLPNSGKQ